MNPQTPAPLSHTEALRRATENDTTVHLENRREDASLRGPTYFPKDAAKLADAETKLEKQTAAVENERARQAQVIMDWDDLCEAGGTLLARRDFMAETCAGQREHIAGLRAALRRDAGNNTVGLN